MIPVSGEIAPLSAICVSVKRIPHTTSVPKMTSVVNTGRFAPRCCGGKRKKSPKTTIGANSGKIVII
ncbi:hypothetical protein D1872_341790 [compost metagenome]